MGAEYGDAVPARLGKFVGRSRERRQLRQLVAADAPLITVTGLSGVGKTRLVREALADLIDVWVSASDIEDNASLVPAVEQRAEALLTKVAVDRQLIILDSIDDDVVGRQLIAALDLFPGLQVVITSRTRMNVRGEVLLRLEPLPYPIPGLSFETGDASRWEAIEYFIQAAERVRPGFTLTRDNAATVVELVQATGGLPLAIDIVANWLRVSNLDDLLRRVKSSFEPFTDGPADLPDRQRDLQSSIQSSIDQLEHEDRDVLAALAHLGAVSIEGLGRGLDRPVPFASLGRLVDRNLVEPSESATAGITLHPMVRRVANSLSDGTTAQQRFLEWLDDELTQVVPTTATAQSRTAFKRLDQLSADIAAALDLLADQPSPVAAIIATLYPYWLMTYQRRLQVGWTTKALHVVGADDPSVIALHLGAAHGHPNLYNLTEANRHSRLALTMARAAGERAALATALSHLLAVGVVSGLQGLDEERAEAIEICTADDLFELLAEVLSIEAERLLVLGRPLEALAVAQSGVTAALKTEILTRTTWCLLVESWAHTRLGDFDAAARCQGRALVAAEKIDARSAFDLAVFLYEADTLAAAGRVHEGIDRVRRVVAGLQRIEVPIGLRQATGTLAELLSEIGEHREARQQYRRTIELASAFRDRLGICEALLAVAISPPHVRPSLQTCDQILRCVPMSVPGVMEGLTSDRAARLSALQQEIQIVLGPPPSNSARLSLDHVTTSTLQDLADSEQPIAPHGLSRREIDVLRHLALGETDGEIASTLTIGTRTVNSHVSSILRKLGVERRRQAAAWARANLELGRLDEQLV